VRNEIRIMREERKGEKVEGKGENAKKKAK
jgi:hypothetical protein